MPFDVKLRSMKNLRLNYASIYTKFLLNSNFKQKRYVRNSEFTNIKLTLFDLL
jgi:hypothetical protein